MTIKTALVTGAARGIGLAVARRFLAEGWNVALLDINADQLRETMAALAEPSKTLEIICDVSDPPAITAAVRLAAAHFFGKDGTVFGIGLTGIFSVALTFGAICMADTSLSGFIPKSVEVLVISLCTGTVVLLVTSAAAQVLGMGFGPSLGLQLVFWNIVFLAQLATRFLMDFWKHV